MRVPILTSTDFGPDSGWDGIETDRKRPDTTGAKKSSLAIGQFESI